MTHVLLVPLVGAMLFAGSGSATASGPETVYCTGTSSPPPVFSSSGLSCVSSPGPHNDDEGAYFFTYAPALDCTLPAGIFLATASGPEGIGSVSGLPGGYTSNGTVLSVTFSYTLVEKSLTPEAHLVRLDIYCPTGATVGSIQE
jgi:hypothetical protein